MARFSEPGSALGSLILLGFIFIFEIILAIASYVYMAIALSAIARKTKTPNPWLAWIPIANYVLIWQISQTPLWTIISVFTASFIYVMLSIIASFVGSIAAVILMIFAVLILLSAMVITVWWYWRITVRRGFSPWYLLLNLIPIAGPYIFFGILAWSDRK